MEKFSWSMLAKLLLCFALCVPMTSCGGDDEDDLIENTGGNGESGGNGGNAGTGSVNNVSAYNATPMALLNTMGMYFYVDGEDYFSGISDVIYDSNNRMTQCKYQSHLIEISYSGSTVNVLSRPLYEGGNSNDRLVCHIGSNGFISSSKAYYTDNYGHVETSNTEYYYDRDGHFIGYNDTSDGQVHRVEVVYNSDGDIVKVHDSYNGKWDNSSYDSVIAYTDSNHSTPIDNKNGVMLFDECFEVDFDEMIVLYYAGLFGKGTTHLPLSLTTVGDYYDGIPDTFEWQINSAGLPTAITITDAYGNSTLDFSWK